MNKKEMIKIGFAIAAVAFLIFEIFAFGAFGGAENQSTPTQANPNGQDTKEERGISEFYGIVRSYEPYLIVQNLSQPQIDEINKSNLVEDMQKKQGSFYVVVRNSNDIAEAAKLLAENSIEFTTIANIGFPPSIDINTTDGRFIQAAVSDSATVKYPLPPGIPVNEKISIRMTAIVQNAVLIGFEPTSFMILPEIFDYNTTATIIEKKDSIYSFEIPFENRNDIEITDLIGSLDGNNVRYARADYADFGIPLTINETMEKRNLSYVTYIDTKSMSILRNFTDIPQIYSDFEGHNVTLPISRLYIRTNRSVFLNESNSLSFEYLVQVPEKLEDYVFLNRLHVLLTNKTYENGDEFNISITGQRLGSTITEITAITENN